MRWLASAAHVPLWGRPRGQRENSVRMRGGTPASPTESQLTTRPVDLDVIHTGLNKSTNPRKKYCWMRYWWLHFISSFETLRNMFIWNRLRLFRFIRGCMEEGKFLKIKNKKKSKILFSFGSHLSLTHRFQAWTALCKPGFTCKLSFL